MENIESTTPSSYNRREWRVEHCVFTSRRSLRYLFPLRTLRGIIFGSNTPPDSFGITPLERGIILCFYKSLE